MKNIILTANIANSKTSKRDKTFKLLIGNELKYNNHFDVLTYYYELELYDDVDFDLADIYEYLQYNDIIYILNEYMLSDDDITLLTEALNKYFYENMFIKSYKQLEKKTYNSK